MLFGLGREGTLWGDGTGDYAGMPLDGPGGAFRLLQTGKLAVWKERSW